MVNNNAAALVLLLNTLADGREAIVSRGELIEIGGSFRLPEILAKSGARLREVGTTNRTHLDDYRQAIGGDTAVLLKVHTSNYRIVGFTAGVGLAELVALGRERGLPVVEDLGSGALVDLSRFGLPKEPVVAERIAAGAARGHVQRRQASRRSASGRHRRPRRPDRAAYARTRCGARCGPAS